jgi:uncharacterized coiled-coil protein SlyX
MNRLPIYKIKPLLSATTAIALVKEPAIDELFMAFESEKEFLFKSDNEKQIVSGPAMIPNKLIYRNSPQCYVVYDESDIVEFAKQFIKTGAKFNLEHNESTVEVDIFESYFLKADNEWNLPEGTWIVSAKIEDQLVWEDIKSGKFKGFSIQSNFEKTAIENFKNEINNTNMIEQFKEQLNEILFKVNKLELKMAEEVVEEVKVVEDVKLQDPIVQELSDKVVALEEKIVELEGKINSLVESFESRITSLETSIGAQAVAIEEMSKQTVAITTVEKVEKFNVANDSPFAGHFKK